MISFRGKTLKCQDQEIPMNERNFEIAWKAAYHVGHRGRTSCFSVLALSAAAGVIENQIVNTSCTSVLFADVQKCNASSFDQLLTVNIHKLQEIILSSPRLANIADKLTFNTEETSGYDVRWHFVTCNIQLLQLLCKISSDVTEKCDASLPDYTRVCAGTNPETSALPLSSDTLSLAHRKAVSSALQFVSVLGISPLLLPGVGIPLHRRSELACRLGTKDVASCLSNCDKYHHLTMCTDILLDCLEQQALASLILSAHLCDLLASLVQLCYAPVWKTYAAEFEKTRSCRKDVDVIHSHRNYLDELTKLVNQVSSSALVRELLLLQSGCPPSPNMKVHLFSIRFHSHICYTALCL